MTQVVVAIMSNLDKNPSNSNIKSLSGYKLDTITEAAKNIAFDNNETDDNKTDDNEIYKNDTEKRFLVIQEAELDDQIYVGKIKNLSS